MRISSLIQTCHLYYSWQLTWEKMNQNESDIERERDFLSQLKHEFNTMFLKDFISHDTPVTSNTEVVTVTRPTQIVHKYCTRWYKQLKFSCSFMSWWKNYTVSVSLYCFEHFYNSEISVKSNNKHSVHWCCLSVWIYCISLIACHQNER